MFKKLKLIKESTKTTVLGLGGKCIVPRGKVELEILHRRNNVQLLESKFVIVRNFNMYQPLMSFTHFQFSKAGVDDLADPDYNIAKGIDGIIGVDILAKHIKGGICHNSIGLAAQATSFGWIVFGGEPLESSPDSISSVEVITTNDVYNQVKRLWEIDELDEQSVQSAEEQACEQLYESALVRKIGRYSVTLQLKPNTELGESRSMARRRFFCLESRFKRDPELQRAYTQFMMEYESLGHMRPAGPLKPDKLHYYIPHHAVAIEKKFRVVFDASAKTTNGKSLNDVQYVGPRLQKDLFDILMNFRVGKYAVTADICKMFRQIEVQEEYWDLQRILWRKSPLEPIQDYWLTVVTYGMASSPYNAVKTLIQCAKDHSNEYPRAGQVVLNDFYMDDMLTSFEDIQTATELKYEVTALLRKAGFELAKWRSNCEQLMSEPMERKTIREQSSTSVLGIIWNYKDDEFQFKVQKREQPEVITKRIVTSEAARVFDPQGYVTPLTIRAKLFIQELWRHGSDWDEPLSSDLQSKWKGFYEELKLIDQVKIPRWLDTTTVSKVQIHIFCDASLKAYGSVAYTRAWINDQWSTRLLCSKSKVAPIKELTIPRYELGAIELGCKMLARIKKITMFAEAPVFLWTDSEIALYWIRKPGNELKPYVANRVKRICQEINPAQSRHIRSEQNPADMLSRGVKAETLLKSTLWWNGPQMLKENIEDWPSWNVTAVDAKAIPEVERELKTPTAKFSNVYMTLALNSDKEIKLINKFSSHQKVCHITSYVLRFCNKTYEPIRIAKQTNLPLFECYSKSWASEATLMVELPDKDIPVPRPSVEEKENALSYWVKASQEESYSEDYINLSKGRELTKRSSLWMLTPQLDHFGRMRVYGRLAHSDLPDMTKHPIILHRSSTLAKKLALESHIKLCHGGVQLCTQYLRNKYWIPGVRILLRQVVSKCIQCVRQRKTICNQFMADLPRYRLSPIPAFQRTGVDYAGPIKLKLHRNVTTKGYIAVFVCMVYKTVHLEAVTNQNTDSFIAALSRFISLRSGSVKHMHSDNGKNFCGANRELKEAVEIWNDHKVMEYLDSHSIQWHFTPPYAPHHGGLWEAAVKSTKHHLYRLTGAQLYTYEELATLLTRISACLNSRPLTPMSSDPNDLTTLTPGHFITGRAIVVPYEGYLVDIPMNRLTAWQKIQKQSQEFWDRWSQEYITEQQKRNKWANSQRSLKVGDLVFVRKEVTPACQWLMGRITQTFSGEDGITRTCEINTKGRLYVRPITQLVLLPLDTEDVNTSEPGFP